MGELEDPSSLLVGLEPIFLQSLRLSDDHHTDVDHRASSIVVHASVYAQLLELCLTLCDTVDCSLPGASVHGVLQARVLEWVAMPSCRGSS